MYDHLIELGVIRKWGEQLGPVPTTIITTTTPIPATDEMTGTTTNSDDDSKEEEMKQKQQQKEGTIMSTNTTTDSCKGLSKEGSASTSNCDGRSCFFSFQGLLAVLVVAMVVARWRRQ